LPLLRQNRRERAPLWFGLYGTDADGVLVYHHGAGFRDRGSRLDPLPQLPQPKPSSSAGSASGPPALTLRYRTRLKLASRRRRAVIAKRSVADDDMFAALSSDPSFYKQLL
jgi:hypothetical protein